MSSSVRGGFIEFREIGDLPRIYAYAKIAKQRGWGAFPTRFFQEMRFFWGPESLWKHLVNWNVYLHEPPNSSKQQNSSNPPNN